MRDPRAHFKSHEPSIRLKPIRAATRRRQPGAPHKTSTDERSNDWTTRRRRSTDARGFVSVRFDDARPGSARKRRVDDRDDAFEDEIFLQSLIANGTETHPPVGVIQSNRA